MSSIMEDTRKIKSLVMEDGRDITGFPFNQIKPYHENGEMAAVVWFELRHKNGHDQRINGRYVRQIIYYKE